jgi:cytochrome b
MNRFKSWDVIFNILFIVVVFFYVLEDYQEGGMDWSVWLGVFVVIAMLLLTINKIRMKNT